MGLPETHLSEDVKLKFKSVTRGDEHCCKGRWGGGRLPPGDREEALVPHAETWRARVKSQGGQDQGRSEEGSLHMGLSLCG